MNPNWRTITVIFCIAVTIIAIVYDVIADRQGGVSATISRVIRQAAMDYPIIAFSAGVLIGHLFWSQKL